MMIVNISLWLAAAALVVFTLALLFGVVHMAVMMAKQQEF